MEELFVNLHVNVESLYTRSERVHLQLQNENEKKLRNQQFWVMHTVNLKIINQATFGY